jgi:hypothetical protein
MTLVNWHPMLTTYFEPNFTESYSRAPTPYGLNSGAVGGDQVVGELDLMQLLDTWSILKACLKPS